MSYLLAWKVDINAVDSEGLTPLHLAIKAAEECKHSRAIKHLLLRGACRTIKDNYGRTPLDVARDLQSIELRAEIFKLLETPTFCTCCMVRPPLTKLNKSFQTMNFYIFLMLVAALVYGLILHPMIQNYTWTYYLSFLFAIKFIFFFILICSDPGYLNKDQNIDFI